MTFAFATPKEKSTIAQRIANAILTGRMKWPKLEVARNVLARAKEKNKVGSVDLGPTDLVSFFQGTNTIDPSCVTAACAAGFALLGGETDDPQNLQFATVCPEKGCHSQSITIPHLNDKHNWMPEQVADWLQTL